MFSNNNKISQKQFVRMVLLPIFANLIFVLPHLSAKMYGKSVLLGLALFLVLACLYMGLLFGINYLCTMKTMGQKSKKFVYVIQVVRQMIRFAFYLSLSSMVLVEAQVPYVTGTRLDGGWKIFVVLPLICIAVYGSFLSVEKYGRLFEICFWFTFIPFVLLVVLGYKEVDFGMLFVGEKTSFCWMLLYSCGLLVFLTPVEQILYLTPVLKQNKEKNYIKKMGTIFGKTWVMIVFCVVLSLFMIGIYGICGAQEEPMLTVDLMRYIKLPFGVLERMDIWMIWFMMLGCFILLCCSLFYCRYFLGFLTSKTKLAMGIVLVICCFVFLSLQSYENSLCIYCAYGALVDIPLSILLPLICAY